MSAHIHLDVVCSIPGCGRMLDSHGMCKGHVRRKERGLDVNVPLRAYSKASGTRCSALGCKREAVSDKRCAMHYERIRRARVA